MKRTVIFLLYFAAAGVIWISCSKDSPKPDQTANPVISSISITTPTITTAIAGTISNDSIFFDIAADQALTSATVSITLPAHVTSSPASGAVIDLSNPVTFTVTGKDKDGKDVTATFFAKAHLIPVVAFIGKSATIDGLEDDAKAAATWMKAQYGKLFVYLPASEISASAMENLQVAFYYELNPQPAIDTVDLSPLGTNATATVIANYVRGGGKLLLAGDAANMIFYMGRVPASEAYWTEKCCSGTETTHKNDGTDDWGVSVAPANTSTDHTQHPLFAGLLDINNKVALGDATTREVRLLWWNVGPSGGDCCADASMITNFEKKYAAKKLATLRSVTDYFGFAIVEFSRTDLNTDASFSANVTKNFQGTVLMFNNAIIGYEWDPNGTTNDYTENIKTITKNAIDYLRGI